MRCSSNPTGGTKAISNQGKTNQMKGGRQGNRDQTRVNDRIRAPKVRVVGPDGQQLGVLSIRDALIKAQSLGLDLVEIAAQAEPPVCKIIDYGKFKYEQSKLKKQKSKSATRMKEIKLRVGTGQHDYNIKMGRMEGFLDTGHKVRVIVQFKGRENAHKDLGFVVMQRVIEDLKNIASVDQAPRLGGRVVAMTLTPLPQGQRKRKFHLYHGELLEEDEEDDDVDGEDSMDESDDPTQPIDAAEDSPADGETTES
jgi:translation initiation factor IF-3